MSSSLSSKEPPTSEFCERFYSDHEIKCICTIILLLKAICDGVVCGTGAQCEPSTGRCVCPVFYVGDPEFNCVPREYSF